MKPEPQSDPRSNAASAAQPPAVHPTVDGATVLHSWQSPSPQQLPANVVPLRPWAPPEPENEPTAVRDESLPAPTPLAGTPGVHLPQWPIALVLCGIVVSLAVMVVESFRIGTLAMASSLVLAFFLRLVLSDREAGMLKVRHRWIDLIVLGILAATMVIFGFWVPAPN